MTTEESNKLIAEFMGIGSEVTDSYLEHFLKGKKMTDDLLFHTSWDWLMPVAEECFQCDYEEGGDLHMILNDAIMTINIDEVYEAVVKFIQWYNQNKES